MLTRAISLVLLAFVLAAGSGYLVSAGTMPWPIPVTAVALALLVLGIATVRSRRRPADRAPLLNDTEPAGVEPPPG